MVEMLSHEEQEALVRILIDYGTIDTTRERKHFWEESGLASYDRELPSEIELDGTQKEFAQSVVYKLKKQGLEGNNLKLPMIMLLQYLQSQAAGQAQVISVLAPLLARFENPIGYILPQEVERWRVQTDTSALHLLRAKINLYLLFDDRTLMSAMVTSALISVCAALLGEITKIKSATTELFFTPTTIYRNGFISWQECQVIETLIRRVEQNALQGVIDLDQLQQWAQQTTQGTFLTIDRLRQMHQSIQIRIDLVYNVQSRIVEPVLSEYRI